MDLTALRTRVRNLSGVQMTTILDNAELDTFLNAAYHEFLRREQWPFLRVTATFSTVASTAEYAVPQAAGSIDIRDVWEVIVDDDGSVPLRERTEAELDEWYDDDDVDAPREYARIDHDTLRLRPIPDAVYTVTVKGRRVSPSLVLLTDEPLFRAEYHEGLAYLAAAKVLRREGDDSGRADVYEAEAAAAYRDMVADYMRGHDRQTIIMGGRRSNRIYPRLRWRPGF
ncbi:MAG: hypothetical protein ACRDUY_08790 [Nitriliruptorales bacterium]